MSSSNQWITLNAVQSGSAAINSSFLVLHLAAPLTAVFKGETGASRIMVVARELYQAYPFEGIFVFGSIAVHVAAGLAKRFIRTRQSGKLSLNTHQKAGYLLVPIVIGHAYTHRIAPLNIGISPTLLSYNFVGYSFSRKPITTTLSYAAIVLTASYHAVAGIRCLSSGRRKQAKLKEPVWKGAASLLAGSLALGIARMAVEYQKVPNYVAKGYARVLGLSDV